MPRNDVGKIITISVNMLNDNNYKDKEKTKQRIEELVLKVKIDDNISKILTFAADEHGGQVPGNISTLGKAIDNPE